MNSQELCATALARNRQNFKSLIDFCSMQGFFQYGLRIEKIAEIKLEIDLFWFSLSQVHFFKLRTYFLPNFPIHSFS